MKIDTNKLNISKKHLIAIAVIVVTGIVLGSAILGGKATKKAEDDGHGHGSHVEAKAHSDGEHHGKASGDKHDHDKGHADGEHHEAPTKGPHGGKLYKEGDFGLEALLAEDNGEPRLRIWLFDKDKPLPSGAAKVSATITRLTGEKQTLNFAPDKDSLLSREVVPEPHAFEISIVALARRNRQAMFDPSGEGTIYLFADNIQPGQEGAVLMHECVHKHAQTTLGQAAWRRHVDTLKAWTHRPIESLERKIHDIALQRAQSAAGGEADLLDEELFAYAVETAVAMGIRPRLGAQRDSAQKWLTDVALTIEKALVTVFSASAPTLDAQQLVDLAYALAQLESPHAQEIRQRLGTARAELAQRLATLVAPVQRGRPTKGLSSSAICDKGGQPLTLYHFTLHSGDLDPQKTTDHGLHFGTLEQALMRRAGKKGHVVAAQLDALKVRRSTDTGSSWRSKIQSAKKAGFDAIVYLNRFEGLSNESVEALAKIDVDSLSDQEFKRLAPEARDSYVVFYADQVHRMGLNEVVGPILHSTSPEESQQDASNRRWRENFELVVTADSLASLKLSQIQSAMGYISHQIARLGPGRAWEGDQAARARIDSLNRELDLLRFEVRMRERSGIDMQQKLVVNGVARSRVNSAGQRIHPSDEGIANFWRWFGNSVTVDALGRPLVLYHGTASDFTSFDLSLGGLNHDTSDSKGVAWLTTSPYRAAAAAKDAAIVRADAPVNDGAQILPFYARVEQPHKLRSAANRSPGQLASSMNVARLKNRDGLIVAKGEMGGMDVAIFDPRQVKSALGNDGLFDRDSADFIGVAHTTTDDMRPAEVPHEQSQLR